MEKRDHTGKEMTKSSMTWLPDFWGAFKKSIRYSGDADYLPLEKNQTHLKVPDNQPALEFHFYCAKRHCVSPQQASKIPYKNYDGRCLTPGHMDITALGVK